MTPYLDYGMEVYMLFAMVCFFWQWREQLNIYVEENYIKPIEKLMRLKDWQDKLLLGK